MDNLSHIIQGYIGMTPKDKNCQNWIEMQSKMEEEINEFFQKEHEANIRKNVFGGKGDENAFKEAALPLIKYLCENHNPHTTVIVTPTNAELFGGLQTTGDIYDYLKD